MSKRIWPALALAGLLLATANCSRAPKESPPGTTGGKLAPSAVEDGFHVVVEAEAYSAIHAPIAAAAERDASGGNCVRIPLTVTGDKEKSKPKEGRLELKVTLPAADAAHCWFRAYWRGVCSNSFTLDIPGQRQFTVGEDNTYNAWHWVKLRGPGLPLAAGEHTITIAEREDGIAIDQLVITSDADFVPSGIEK